MPILVHFEDERKRLEVATLLVVFKMHGLQQQKTGVGIKIQESKHFNMFAIMHW